MRYNWWWDVFHDFYVDDICLSEGEAQKISDAQVQEPSDPYSLLWALGDEPVTLDYWQKRKPRGVCGK